jgi:hypothetical protein
MARFEAPRLDAFSRDIDSNIGSSNPVRSNVVVPSQRVIPPDELDDVLNGYQSRLRSSENILSFLKREIIERIPPGPVDDLIRDRVRTLTGGAELSRQSLDCIYQVSTYVPENRANEIIRNTGEKMDSLTKEARKMQPISFGAEFLWLLIRIVFAVIVHGIIGYLCWWLPATFKIPIPILSELPKMLGKAFGELERVLIENPIINFKCVYRLAIYRMNGKN